VSDQKEKQIAEMNDRCTVEIPDEDENVVIVFNPAVAGVAMAAATIIIMINITTTSTNNNDIIIGSSNRTTMTEKG
jgi:hypothetical protein